MTGCVLALELSTPCGSVAVVNGAQLLFSATFQAQRSHNAQVFQPLQQALAAAGENLSGIVVGIGPGSYTGIRIAIAAAHGISLARAVPVAGLNSLVAATDAGNFGVVGDARRGRWYVASVKDGLLDENIAIVSPADLDAAMAATNQTEWLSMDQTAPAVLPTIQLAQPCAIRLARLATHWTSSDWEKQAEQSLEPRYLEGAFITQAKKRPTTR